MRARVAWMLALAAAHAWPAGMIRGIVLEHTSGRPLSRSRVRLEALRGTSIANAATLHTDRSGQFIFGSLPDGAYLLTAERAGYFPARYGQRKKTSQGSVILLSGDFNLFAELRMSRLGAITGRVLDENQVALPGQSVVVYEAKLPLTQAGKGLSDDRGVYRVGGLAPGRYYVRTAARLMDDGSGFLPTFHPQSAMIAESKLVEVRLDADSSDVDVEPLPGKLFQLGGRIQGPPAQVQVTLVSDTGLLYQSIAVPGDYRFEGLSPGNYEIFVESSGPPPPLTGQLGAYHEFFVDRDAQVHLEIVPFPRLRLRFEDRDGGRALREGATLFARRKDLAGDGPAIRLPDSEARLGPGIWEISAVTAPEFYFASLATTAYRRSRLRREQAENPLEIYLVQGGYPEVRVTLSARPARLRGTVRSAGRPSPGAPVFLYALDPVARKRLNGLRVERADAQGVYRFTGLSPGEYLVLSTFEWDNPTEEMLITARAKTATLREGQEAAQDLELYWEPEP